MFRTFDTVEHQILTKRVKGWTNHGTENITADFANVIPSSKQKGFSSFILIMVTLETSISASTAFASICPSKYNWSWVLRNAIRGMNNLDFIYKIHAIVRQEPIERHKTWISVWDIWQCERQLVALIQPHVRCDNLTAMNTMRLFGTLAEWI